MSDEPNQFIVCCCTNPKLPLTNSDNALLSCTCSSVTFIERNILG